MKFQYGDIELEIKFDGCANLYDNSDPEHPDYIHICHWKKFVEFAQEVEKQAKEHYGKDWVEW